MTKPLKYGFIALLPLLSLAFLYVIDQFAAVSSAGTVWQTAAMFIFRERSKIKAGRTFTVRSAIHFPITVLDKRTSLGQI